MLNLWRCRACDKAGSVVDWVMVAEGVPARHGHSFSRSAKEALGRAVDVVSGSYTVEMRTVTVELPDEMAERAETVAAESGMTVGELAREAIEARLGEVGGHRFTFTGIAASGDGGLSENFKSIRRAEFGS